MNHVKSREIYTPKNLKDATRSTIVFPTTMGRSTELLYCRTCLRVCRGQSSWTGLSVFVFLLIALRLKLGVRKVALGTLGQLKFTLIGFKGGGYLAHFLHALFWMISKQA